jgi:hypothetical protein
MKKALVLGLLVLLAGSSNVSAKNAPKASPAKTVAKVVLTTAIAATTIVAATYGLDYALQWASAQGYINNDNICVFVNSLHSFINTINSNAIHAYTVASGALTSAYAQAQPYIQQGIEKAASSYAQAKEFAQPYAHQAMEIAKTGFTKAQNLATVGLDKAQGFFAGLYNAGKSYFMPTLPNPVCPITAANTTDVCSLAFNQ